MDTPAECDEWLAATHPEFHAALQERNQKVKDERAAQIAALEAEKQEAEMEAAMAAEAGMDDDEAATAPSGILSAVTGQDRTGQDRTGQDTPSDPLCVLVHGSGTRRVQHHDLPV